MSDIENGSSQEIDETPEVPVADEKKQSADVFTRLSNAMSVDKDRDWSAVSRRVATRMLAGGGATLAVLAGGLAGFRAVYADKIYPGITIGDVAVGGMTVDEAIEAVQKRVDELNQSTVEYTLDSHTWTPTLEELGISVNVAEAVNSAATMGRADKAVDRITFTNDVMQGDRLVPLPWDVKPWLMDAWLDTVDADIDDPAIDAVFTVEGSNLNITQDSTGTAADRDSVTAAVLNSLKTLEPVKAKLPTVVDHPRITKSDLEANEPAVLNILSNSVTVRFEDKRWEILPEEVSGFMVFESTMENGRPETSVDFDRALLTRYLRDRFSPEVNRMPVNARVQFYQNKLTPTSNAEAGKTLKANEFADLVAESFIGDHSRVDVPVVTTEAKVREDNLDTLGIKERLCRVDSNYRVDLGTVRATNVEVGVNLLNNVIIPPGEDFSFNRAVGSIAANPNFVGGTAIVAGVIQDEFGGGICQVSTTAFRAAIKGGFPITEWHPHTYRLSGYELDGWGPGYDASILQPDWQPAEDWADFRFTNNTKNFILISSWVDGGIHVIEVYGTSEGWDVQLSGTTTWEVPPSDDNRWNIDWNLGAGTNYPSAWPMVGLGASFTRTVYDAEGKEMYTRDFTSNFHSRGWQCTCSPDMEGIQCW